MSINQGQTQGVEMVADDASGNQMFVVSDTTVEIDMTAAITIAASYGSALSAIRVDTDTYVTAAGTGKAGAITNASPVNLSAFDGYVYELTLYPTGETSSDVLSFW